MCPLLPEGLSPAPLVGKGGQQTLEGLQDPSGGECGGGRQGLECSSQTPRCLGTKLGKSDGFVLAN